MYTFVNFRVIPVHYDYHGYIKQMVVKCNCYKDCNTDYIIILDSDLLLKKLLNFDNLLNNNKIEWHYLKKESDPTNVVFNVWKKAVEDSTLREQNIHYMSNGFPFLFTKQSLHDADNYFIHKHNCNYDTYCKKRCEHLKIDVNKKTTDIFENLSKIFTEFEYLGHYFHNFSSDYTFIKTKHCKMKEQCQNFNTSSYFIQNWSHGNITNEIRNNIINLLK